jgi:hypothetical protein
MEYILSFDIGIKNLAFCLFEKKCNFSTSYSSYRIIKWDVINLIDTNEMFCLELEKTNKICNKKAIYTKNNKCYCLKHSKKSEFMIPILDFKKSRLNKMGLNELKELASKQYIQFELNIKKKELIELINNFIIEKTLEPIQISKCNDYDLISLSKNINRHFDEVFNIYLSKIKYVCIENQMTSRMRCLSFIVMEYFLVKNNLIEVQMVNPCFKLKDLEVEKTDYSNRKKNSVKHCLNILKNNNIGDDWIAFFEKNKKKDDLSDCFLQGVYVMNKVYPILFQDNNTKIKEDDDG